MKFINLNIDILKIIFYLFFISIMLILFFWVITPFILSFVWATIIVITTWPLIIKLKNFFWDKKLLAIIIIATILILLFIIPIFFIVDNLIDNGIDIIHRIFSHDINIPELYWLNKIPIIGNRLYISYHKLASSSLSTLISIVQPYIGKTTGFFVAQASYFGQFMIHLVLVFLFSIILYYNGEKINIKIINFANRISKNKGKKIVFLTIKLVRLVVLSVLVTALVQGILSGIGVIIAGVPYAPIITTIITFLCLLQIGPLPILIPSIIYLYWNGDSFWGTILLIWSIFVAIIDNILKPIIIRHNNDLPLITIFFGTIGGFLAFGMIGLFIGPVILSISYHLITEWIKEKTNKHSIINLIILSKK